MMRQEAPPGGLAARPLTLYSLRVVPLWDGDAERIELGDDLHTIIATILREKSVDSLVGADVKPMRFCQLEEQAALQLVGTHRIFYARERASVWKVMVPAAGVYSRETIVSCLSRNTGRNVEKYENVLFLYPKASEFYTFSSSEIRPVDTSVFVIEAPAR